MTTLSSDTIHATSVAIGGRAVLIEGVSGSGKSDLGLRLIDRGAQLVSDDYSHVRRDGSTLFASAPQNIAGRMEVRGVGIVAMDHTDETPVALVVVLGEPPARLPEPGVARTILGIAIPFIALDGREPSAPIKVELALARAADAT